MDALSQEQIYKDEGYRKNFIKARGGHRGGAGRLQQDERAGRLAAGQLPAGHRLWREPVPV